MPLRRVLAICGPLVILAPGLAQEATPPLFEGASGEPVATFSETSPPAEAAVAPEPLAEERSLTADPTQQDVTVEPEVRPHTVERLPPTASYVDPATMTEPVIGNQDVIEMVAAELSDSTIIAAIGANLAEFDVSPRALVALKRAGVSERVIEAMIATEAANKRVLTAPVDAAAGAGGNAAVSSDIAPETLAALSQVIERLAAQTAAQEAAQETAEPERERPALERSGEARRVMASEGRAERSDSPTAPAPRVPRAWIVENGERLPIVPTIAQVALTDVKRNDGTALKTLQSLAGKALAFANPAFGLAASGLGGLFRGGDSATAVWALTDAASSRQFSTRTVFEIEFGGIPGLDPDRYRPAIVQLVPTNDNYRIVGAAKTSGEGPVPTGPIIEEPVPVELTQLGRGSYRVALGTVVPPGEYALVLRPLFNRERARKREKESSLGELMGGGASQVIYMTWDFTLVE